MHEPTIIEQPSAAAIEAVRAKLWRKNVLRVSPAELGKRIGYSRQSVQMFERGYDYKGRPIGERAWKRYRCCCAGLGVRDFAWGQGERSEQFRKDIEAGRKLMEHNQ